MSLYLYFGICKSDTCLNIICVTVTPSVTIMQSQTLSSCNDNCDVKSITFWPVKNSHQNERLYFSEGFYTKVWLQM